MSALYAPTTPTKFVGLAMNLALWLMLNDGSSGLNETRLRARRIPTVRTNNPMNSFSLRCSEGTRCAIQFIAGDFSGIHDRKRVAPQYLVESGKRQTSKCCAFASTASGMRSPYSQQCRKK